MIGPGDLVPRCDTDREVYVVVLSNSIHLAADTGRAITCPFIPGQIPDAAMALVVRGGQPDGVALPELVQWLPTAAFEPIGNIGTKALREATRLMIGLVT